jgi:hypothetical protein
MEATLSAYEVKVLRLDAYMNDPRRLAMAAGRDAAIARTDIFRITA